MPDTLTRCRTCRALANPAWLTCAACAEPLNAEEKNSIEAPTVPLHAYPIRVGIVISWERADLGKHQGVVDFLHTDPDGTVWAFVTMLDGWTAVNTKHLIKSEEGSAKP